MRFAKVLKSACFLILMVVGYTATVYGIDERYAASSLDGSKGQIKKDSFSLVKDTVWFDPNLKPSQITNSVRSIITFRINEFSTKMLAANFAVTARLRIDYVKSVLINGSWQNADFVDSFDLSLT